ncbi:MAG: YfhO family protein, partial [Eubacteriales bacterium]|nr:YfhO family protein [Eubacteriales bacterium]
MAREMKVRRKQAQGVREAGLNREAKFLLYYTVVFAAASWLAFRYFPENGKRMVWKQDGLTQHYVALCYYARWGRSILRSILRGKPSFPTFNLHIGYGADLLTTLQYYVIGDPFSLPAVFVPQKYMLWFHDAMIILRLYVAGICFDRYCCKMGYRKIAGNLCGAVVYLFGNYTLFGIRHPYFLNALIWFPLLLIGAECILRGEGGRRFSAAVFLSCISNFYFFYMLVLLTVMYTVWRTLRLFLFPVLFQNVQNDHNDYNNNRKNKDGRRTERAGRRNPRSLTEAWKQIGRLTLHFISRGLLGTAMGMCLFLPVILRFLGDPRSSGGVANPFFYQKEYYTGFAEAFISYGTKITLENWTCMGFGAAGLLGVLALFLGRKGRHSDLKAAWLVMLAMTLFPAAGVVMNGFTYPANRWGWAFTLLCAFITVAALPEIAVFPVGRMAVLYICLGVYAIICRQAGAPAETMQELLLAAAAALLIRLAGPAVRRRRKGGSRKKQVKRLVRACVPVCAALLTAGIHGYECYERGVSFSHSDIRNYSSDLYIAGNAASDAAGMRTMIGPVTGGTFYRYSARDLLNNYSVLHDVSNTQYFWSLSDSRIEQFYTETGQPNGLVDLYDNLDNRTMLDEIAGVKYYKRSDGSLLPFGYVKMEGLKYDNRASFSEKEIEEEGDSFPLARFSFYENQYALPLGFT